MDCMDCHNRPSHNYRTPVEFVNHAITAGKISTDLPEIKSLLMDICDAEFTSMDSAKAAIAKQISEFYQEDYPDVYEEKKALIDQAIVAMQEVFSQNIFPDMGVRWDKYPNHIGHTNFDGCFRCHNDTHANDDGEVISKDCNLCHSILAQGSPGEMEFASIGKGLDFRHPDGDEDWKDGLCTDCHTGLNP